MPITEQADIDAALAALDLPTKVSLLTGRDFWRLAEVPAIGLRSVVMSDGPIGVRGTYWAPDDPTVALPSPTALAATWDVGLAREVGNLLGREARRRGVDVLLAPTVNLHRTPLGGRHFECYSEDPLLTAEIGAAYAAGVQDVGVAATVKHFVANDSETDRRTVDVRVSERALRETYLAPFETIVRRAGVWAVMAAYNGVNGSAMTAHGTLIRDVLKGEWGFDGVLMSDWTATRSTVEPAVGGLDLVMPALGGPWGDALLAAVEAGEVTGEVIDDKVRRILRLAARVGALPVSHVGAPSASRVGAPSASPEDPVARALPTDAVARILPADAGARVLPADAAGVARLVATRSFVLARNDDNLLPLEVATLRRVALIGALAGDARAMGGGSAEVTPPHVISPLDGLADALPSHVELVYRVGAEPRRRLSAVAGEFQVRLLGAKGRELHAATTAEARIRWFGNSPPDVDATKMRSIELTGTITPTVDGEHTLAVSSVGAFTLTVDGERVASSDGPPKDPGAAFADLPETRVTVPMTAGGPVTVAVTQQVVRRGGIPVFVSLELGHEEPGPGPDELIEEAARAAADADVAVVVVGTTGEVESEGFDRTTLDLPGRQNELVARVAAANPRTVVVVNAGSPVLMPWAEDVATILLVWFPGQEAGAALADVLLGHAEPGGRLPTTWPRREEDCPVLSTTPTDGALDYDEGVFIGYRAWDRAGTAPLFPFGHGLGYTDWEYEWLSVRPGEGLGTARVTVRNAGRRPGREVVQVYLAPVEPDDTRPRRWLAGFAVADAGPGESVTVAVPLALRAAQVWDTDAARWRTVSGEYTVEAGASVADRPLAVPLRV